LVVPAGVQVQVSEELSARAQHADVQVVDQDEDGCAGVAAAQADVVEPAVVPKGQLAVGIDLVVADPEVAVDERDAAGGRFGPGRVGLGGGMAADGAVWPDVVVIVAEGVQLPLQFVGGACAGLGGQPLLLGLMKALDLAAGLQVVGPGVAEEHAAVVQGDFEGDSAVAAVAAGEDGAVVGEQAGRVAVECGDAAVSPVDGGRSEDGGCGAGQTEPGVVVDPVEDLGVGAVDQRPVGDVGLPALVGLFGGEADVAALGPLVRLWGEESAGGEDPPDRGDRAAMVAAPASWPRLPRSLRRATISSSRSSEVRVGLRSGRRERGCSPVSPSAR
jgi:hypothetical protein